MPPAARCRRSSGISPATLELVAEEVRAGRTARLTALSEEIALLAIRLLADDAMAAGTRARVLADAA